MVNLKLLVHVLIVHAYQGRENQQSKNDADGQSSTEILRGKMIQFLWKFGIHKAAITVVLASVTLNSTLD